MAVSSFSKFFLYNFWYFISVKCERRFDQRKEFVECARAANHDFWIVACVRVSKCSDNKQCTPIAALRTTLQTVNKRMKKAGLLRNNFKCNTQILPEKQISDTTTLKAFAQQRLSIQYVIKSGY
jgi:hypothetical protein